MKTYVCRECWDVPCYLAEQGFGTINPASCPWEIPGAKWVEFDEEGNLVR